MINQILSNDIQLIIEICKENKNENFIKQKISLIKNWNEFINVTYSHGVFPLFYETLKKYNVSIPDEIFIKIKSINIDIIKQNMLMTTELIKVLKLLEKNGIEVISFKGPTLSAIAYGNISLRQYSDLDILIKKDDVFNSAQSLVQSNYIPMSSIEFLKNEAKLKVEKNYEFYNKTNNIKLELHWDLINERLVNKFTDTDIWNHKKIMTIHKYNIQTLNIEILVIYLCLHGASHTWERISWILDIHKLIISHFDELNWNKIVITSKKLNSFSILLLGLGLSKKLFNTKLPSKITDSINSTNIQYLINKNISMINDGIIFENIKSNKRKILDFKYELYLKETTISKIGFVLNTIFKYTDRDVMYINLPKKYFFLYYPIRFFRLLTKYIKILK